MNQSPQQTVAAGELAPSDAGEVTKPLDAYARAVEISNSPSESITLKKWQRAHDRKKPENSD